MSDNPRDPQSPQEMPVIEEEGNDLSRFVETGEGFAIVSEGSDDEGAIPVYDWDQKDPEVITEEQNLDQ